MSAFRLSVARLFPLLALAALAPFAACTRATPGYCAKSEDCAEPFTCAVNIHTCVTADASNDAGDAGTNSDAPADSPRADAGDDHSSTADGSSSDAADAGTDAFHGCVDNQGCTDPTKPVCQTDGGACVGCLASSNCTTAGARACDTTAKKCVECVGNSDCTDPTRPVCDNQACRGCRVDSDCAGVGPGVCMFHLDHHCATDSETVYVSNTTGSCSDSDPAAGTSQLPFCSSQAGIDMVVASMPAPVDAGTGADAAAGGDASSDGGSDAATPTLPKKLVVLRGPAPLTEWSFNAAGRTITLVGQSSAVVTPGSHMGIHLSAGTVYMRGLHVTAAAVTPAIIADGAELHLDRCVVDSNAKGGMQIDGAGFEITNSVFANNGPGTFSGSISWSGALLGAVPAGKPATFLNNTVVNNMAPGVVCTQGNSHDILGSILFQNTVAQSLVCNVVTCCSGDPGLNASYRLMAMSPCIDQLAANMSTAYDIDGDPRPYNTLSDCGADEYVGP